MLQGRETLEVDFSIQLRFIQRSRKYFALELLMSSTIFFSFSIVSYSIWFGLYFLKLFFFHLAIYLMARELQ